jgi:CBS domain-containing protein
MKVSELMIQDVATVRLTDTLEQAAHLMWDRDIGCLPVVDGTGRLLGILTDRDVCMSAYARGEPLRAIPVTVAMASRVYSCGADDELVDVEATMARQRVRRVPVLEESGRVIGILSLDDIAQIAVRSSSISEREVAATLAAIAGTPAASVDPDC